MFVRLFKILKFYSIIMLGLGYFLSISACDSNPLRLQVKANDQGQSSVKNFYFTNGLEVHQINGDYENGLYRGRVTLRNARSQTRRLQYQFTWYDKDNHPLVDDSAWTPMIVYGKGERLLVGIAPNETASGFSIGIRDLDATKVFKTNFLGKY